MTISKASSTSSWNASRPTSRPSRDAHSYYATLLRQIGYNRAQVIADSMRSADRSVCSLVAKYSSAARCSQRQGKSEVEETEECFQKAIPIAQRQDAKSLELRAVMSLSRLWKQQDKKKEARKMLADIYGWFTEGFETADLQPVTFLVTIRQICNRSPFW